MIRTFRMLRRVGHRGAYASLAVAFCSLAVSSPASAQTSFTWSGAAAPGTPAWSSTDNWVGGTPPSGAVGTLTFPRLTGAACTSTPPTGTCYVSNNDLAGLNVNALSIDDGGGSGVYSIGGNAITLGGGGLTASTTSTTFGSASLRVPITLGASQAWSIDGNGNGSQLGLYSNVSGPTSNSLAVTLNHQTFLGLNGNDVEVGPVTVTGGDPSGTGNRAFVNGGLAAGNPSSGAQLNATDGQPVSITHAGLTSLNASVGALTVTGGNIQVGEPGQTPSGALTINGPLTLDSGSAVNLFINHAGTAAGSDYSAIASSGQVSLGNAVLTLSGGSGACPSLNTGDADTLVSAAGISGTFAGIPDGSTVSMGCAGTQPKLRINYTANTVTATVVPDTGPPAPAPPVLGKTAQVAPEKGKVLIKLPKGTSPKAFGLSAAATSGFVPLTAATTVPVGSTLDTTRGQVRLSTARSAAGGSQTGHFGKGVFQIQQQRKNPLTTLSMTGGGLNACHTKVPSGGAPKQVSAARKRRRTLFSNVHGHFRTRGRNSAATVRGTKWTMTDTCAGTLTKVARGTVVVRDFRLRKNIVVKAGHRYLARSLRLVKHH